MSDEPQFGLSTIRWTADQLHVNSDDRRVLRDLAAQVAEMAARPIEQEKRESWRRHNSLQRVRPLVFCDPEYGWAEVIPAADLKCTGDLSRGWEMVLRQEIFWGTQMRDDRVIEAEFGVPHVYTESDWGLHETIIGGEQGGSYVWEAPLRDYTEDLPKLRFPVITVDEAASERMLTLAQETLGDTLNVHRKTIWWWSQGMTMTLIYLRGLTQLMLDMMDNPEELHRIMAFLRDGHLAKLDFLEAHGLLSLNNDGTYVGSGGFGWTDELPQADFSGKVRTVDMWGFSESQETVGVSPALFAEFIFPYQLPLLERFGLNCYGCCEPLDKRWHVVEQIPRLRRVSVSAWVNVEQMAEMLGSKYIFSWKPHPAPLAMEHFDEEAIRGYLRSALRATRDCVVEVIMKDNHTVRNDPRRLVRWVQIAREEIEAL